MSEVLNNIKDRLEQLSNKLELSIRYADPSEFRNIGQELPGMCGWCGPDNYFDRPPEHAKVLCITGKTYRNGQTERLLRELRKALVATHPIEMFNLSKPNIINEILEPEKSHMEIIRPPWYDRLVALLNEYGIDANDKQYDGCNDCGISNKLLEVERRFVIDSPPVHGREMVQFHVMIPWRLSPNGDLFLTPERMEWFVNRLKDILEI